jgi:hypothetical protein
MPALRLDRNHPPNPSQAATPVRSRPVPSCGDIVKPLSCARARMRPERTSPGHPIRCGSGTGEGRESLRRPRGPGVAGRPGQLWSDLWQGLAQICAAITHAARREPEGRRAARVAGERLTAFAATGDTRYGLDLDAVTACAPGRSLTTWPEPPCDCCGGGRGDHWAPWPTSAHRHERAFPPVGDVFYPSRRQRLGKPTPLAASAAA